MEAVGCGFSAGPGRGSAHGQQGSICFWVALSLSQHQDEGLGRLHGPHSMVSCPGSHLRGRAHPWVASYYSPVGSSGPPAGAGNQLQELESSRAPSLPDPGWFSCTPGAAGARLSAPGLQDQSWSCRVGGGGRRAGRHLGARQLWCPRVRKPAQEGQARDGAPHRPLFFPQSPPTELGCPQPLRTKPQAPFYLLCSGSWGRNKQRPDAASFSSPSPSGPPFSSLYNVF